MGHHVSFIPEPVTTGLICSVPDPIISSDEKESLSQTSILRSECSGITLKENVSSHLAFFPPFFTTFVWNDCVLPDSMILQ